jgi:lysozyme
MKAVLQFLSKLFKRAPKAKPGASAPAKTAKTVAKVVTGGVLGATAVFVAPWEGYFGKTYIDPVGVPTVCYGETRPELVAEGRTRTFTKAECVKMLETRLPHYDVGLRRCLHREMPRSVHIAMLSATYNIGIGGFCKSTMAKKINAGDFKAACDALLAWNKGTIKGQRVVIKGLDNRRHAERKVCLEGL